jgi:hypothetical protein
MILARWCKTESMSRLETKEKRNDEKKDARKELWR